MQKIKTATISFILFWLIIPVATAATNDTSTFTNRIIVKYKNQPMSQQKLQTDSNGLTVINSTTLSAMSASTGEDIHYVKPSSVSNTHIISIERFESVEAIQLIADEIAASDSMIEFAEPDYILYPFATTPTDPEFASMWNLDVGDPDNGKHGMNLPDAWDLTTGSSNVVVAVLDTGILAGHADFDSDRILPGWDMISDYPANDFTMANDGNGRDYDPSDPGDWAEVGDTCYTGIAAQDKSSWHGTHVAGTIGAKSNNAVGEIGIAGVDWKTSIVPVRVLGKCGGYTSDIADGISWAAGILVTGTDINNNPADVINMSLGGPYACNFDDGTGKTLQLAIDAAVAAGTTIVVAAGNEASDLDVFPTSPANCNNVINVGAYGHDSLITSYSNYGSTVDVMAPGGHGSNCPFGIKSLMDGGAMGPVNDDLIDCMAGTSMAAPHISGLVSLMLSVDNTLTPAEIETLIKANARSNIASGVCASADNCGAGIADAAATITAVLNALVPQAPSNVSLNTSVSSQITLSWTDNSSTETGFKVARSLDGVDFSNILYIGVTVDETSYVDATTSDEIEYSYSVTAYNANGDSSPANSPNSTPTLPAPTNLSASAISTSQINLTWTDNATSEDNMIVESSSDGVNFSILATLGADTTSYSNAGLDPNTIYYYRVYVENATLTSVTSNIANATTSDVSVLAAPTGLVAITMSSGQINVTWTDNADTETSYIAESSTDGSNFNEIGILPADTVGFSYVGLRANTTYYIRVYAVEGATNSDYSNIASATTSAAKKSGGSIDWILLFMLVLLGMSRTKLVRSKI